MGPHTYEHVVMNVRNTNSLLKEKTMTKLQKEIDEMISSLMFPTQFAKMHVNRGTTYPPYNIIKTSETETVLEIAVAGFKEDEISVVVEDTQLKISGKNTTNDGAEYLYKGIGSRSFEKTFTLPKDSKVDKAECVDGILKVFVSYQIPEEKKPKLIPIHRPGRTFLTE